ncbi:pentapeptide repeat-containing protein [Streptomyces sedi]|uniref:Pentapeptide repeat-containing protein n=1 Tax=Streptomyces sedi TaxID=555059 RepID=A0A5C4UU73_9ACTN|nr:pentapeptide repeat-containing protein [Streptomyces sedi]TNM27085.1 pentapeptide repeat-containing protein [Streptomyces sedi]
MSTPAGLLVPPWPHCGHGADPATDPVGCRGIHVSGHTACFAHLTDADRDTYLASLAPGADIDHRGTLFTADLLKLLLTALHDPITRLPYLGRADFGEARFAGDARFDRARFSGDAWFDGAEFDGGARFGAAKFSRDAGFGETRFAGDARFDRARFSDGAWFGEAEFAGSARFDRAEFAGSARFDRAEFAGSARFDRADFTSNASNTRFVKARFAGEAEFEQVKFAGNAWFEGAEFAGDARFREAQFVSHAWFDGALFAGDVRFGEAWFARHADFTGAQFLRASRWGPVTCAGVLDLSGVVFGVPVTLEIAAREVQCVRTRWESTATIRARHASVDLGHAVLAAPIAVTAHPTPFTSRFGQLLDESPLTDLAGVRMVSVQGVDAALLVLTDTDVSDCLFSGAFHLDQLRLEGRTVFAPPPTGWRRHGLWPVRWTRRRVLAEEHHWRAQVAGQPAPPSGATPSADQWRPGSHHPDPNLTPDPDDIAPLYRQLRKAFEDAKNEPGAADFYYGECEMRRHDHTGTPRVERGLLWGYWLLSGYGLRASRALGWLAVSMLATIVLLMAFGLPTSSPKQKATGTVPSSGGEVTLTIDKQPPQNPTGDRFSSERFEKALSVTFNSVVFRSSGQDLTTTGTYIEMTSRLLEPTLLALAVLALRGRIKR